MNKRHALKSLSRCQNGATAIEYAMVAGMISILIIIGVQNVQGGVTGLYTTLANAVSDSSDHTP